MVVNHHKIDAIINLKMIGGEAINGQKENGEEEIDRRDFSSH